MEVFREKFHRAGYFFFGGVYFYGRINRLMCLMWVLSFWDSELLGVRLSQFNGI